MELYLLSISVCAGHVIHVFAISLRAFPNQVRGAFASRSQFAECIEWHCEVYVLSVSL